MITDPILYFQSILIIVFYKLHKGLFSSIHYILIYTTQQFYSVRLDDLFPNIFSISLFHSHRLPFWLIATVGYNICKQTRIATHKIEGDSYKSQYSICDIL